MGHSACLHQNSLPYWKELPQQQHRKRLPVLLAADLFGLVLVPPYQRFGIRVAELSPSLLCGVTLEGDKNKPDNTYVVGVYGEL